MKGEERIHEQLAGLAMDVGALELDAKNARRHDQRNLDAIAESLREHGQRKPIVAQKVGERLVVRAGNGTLQAAKALGWKRLAVLVVEEDDREATRYALRDNRTAELAEWDDEALRQALRECAESEAEIAALGWTPEEFSSDSIGDALRAEKAENLSTYTQKIKAPIYVPTGEKPSVASLVDRKKAEELIASISASAVPEDISQFLRSAAERHARFDFGRIAEFYAHASPEVQRLMEDSALVIVDFNRAIEGGFVKLTSALGRLADLEEAGDDA